MSASSRSPDRFATTVDREGLVANTGLILAGTLMARLGLLGLIERWVRTGSANPGPKICTVVAAMLAGGTHIDHVGMLRAGRTGRVLGFRPMAPSTVGTLRRTFTFGHVRQLEAVLSRTLARAWGLGAGPGEAPLVVDPGSTIWVVHGKQKQGAAYGLHQRARLSPAARCTRRHRRGARRTHAQRLRGVLARRGALRRRARREPATSRRCRADHGARRLRVLVTEADRPSRRPQHHMVDHRRPHTRCSRQRSKQSPAPPGPTSPTPTAATPKSPRRPMPQAAAKPSAPFASSCAAPSLTEGAQQRLWPDWPTPRIHHQHRTRHRRPLTGSTAATPWSSSPSATSKKAPASSTSPQATTARTAHGSPAPCSPTTSATGPPPSPTRRRPRTAPAAPDSSPSPP